MTHYDIENNQQVTRNARIFVIYRYQRMTAINFPVLNKNRFQLRINISYPIQLINLKVNVIFNKSIIFG